MANDWKAQLANKTGYRTPAQPVQNKILAYDVVEDAEKAIKALQYIDKAGKPALDLTTSQIRKFLTAVNVVRNKVDLYKAQNKNAAILSAELVMEIKFLKVNLLYQAGRTKIVKKFIDAARLDRIIDDIGNDIKKFAKFCKYVEALVAYHKFLGGKDK